MCCWVSIVLKHLPITHKGTGKWSDSTRRWKQCFLKWWLTINQTAWDTHLPRVLFAYRTAIHEATRFSPFRIVYGRSPVLPVDVIIGHEHSIQGQGKSIPAHVRDVGKSLHSMFRVIREHQSQAHQRNKRRYDGRISGRSFVVGDSVWLYVPAVKRGTTKKFSCLWRGPYTVIDKVNMYNYKIQLIGSTHTLVVHRNSLNEAVFW